MRPSVWIVGDWGQAEFSAALTRLQERASCRLFDDVASALAGFYGGKTAVEPAAMLVVQSRPGQIRDSDIARLHAAAPLARLVALAGPWCEGPDRRVQTGVGIVRVPWRYWASRLERELGIMSPAGPPAAMLPRTATDTERIERSCSAHPLGKGYGGRAAIHTSSRETYESLAGLLEQLGICSRLHSYVPGSGVELSEFAVFDGFEQVPADLNTSEMQGQARLLLLHFPRPEDIERAATLKIGAVLARPLLRIDLIAALGRLLPGFNWSRPDETGPARQNRLP